MPTTPPEKTIKERITESIKEADTFAFEMEMLHVLKTTDGDRQVDPQFRHSATYVDPFEGKRRQFDIRGEVSRDNQILLLAVECKKLSPASPIIISQVKRLDKESKHCLIQGPTQVPGGFSPGLAMTNKSTSRLYPTNNFVGKSIFCLPLARNDNNILLIKESHIYERYSQALASLEEMLVFKNSILRPEADPSMVAGIAILVVPDDCLWGISYDEEGAVISDAEPIESSTLYVAREIELGPHDHFNIPHVDLMTESAFKKFVQRLYLRRTGLWEDIFPAKEELTRRTRRD